MDIVLFDAKERTDLLPLTFTRPVAELRMGILTFSERWKKILKAKQIYFITEDYLSKKYPIKELSLSLFINPTYFPDSELILAIQNLKSGEALFSQNEELIAAFTDLINFKKQKFNTKLKFNFRGIHIQYPWDLFTHNAFAISYDFSLITQNRGSQPLSSTVRIIGDPEKIFLEQGARVEYATLNTNEGCIYLDKNSEIMEGSLIRGTFSLGESSKINMGAKIYEGTTIGPFCKVGGEVSNSIFLGYSNKGHDGFMGNSVIGEWCNFGADTNISNMKNNYSEVKYWNYTQSRYIKSGLQFAGLIMGDHSKTAINTQINTGTVVGIFVNLFNSGFPPKYVNSFSWGGTLESPVYKMDIMLEVAERVLKRRGKELTEENKQILKTLYKNG